MSDISMCLNPSCPSRHTCYRHEATPGEFRQSYGEFKVEAGAGRCDMYVPVEVKG